MPNPKSEREFAVDVVRALQAAGHQALFAGGCVRDELLGLTPKDYDVATSALPDEVRRLFRRTVAVGEAFGVVEVLGPRPIRIQVATFRRDGTYSDARRPDDVVFSNAEEDAQRRDFTVNGLFLDPLTGAVADYVGGRADLQARVLRAIGDPYERFREDRLRLLRAVRMAARFGLTVHADTRRAVIEKAAALNDGVSAERIAEELRKMLADANRVGAMRLFAVLGLAAVVLPEWAGGLEALAKLDDPSFPLALAALLPDRATADAVALRLKLSNDERERAGWLAERRPVDGLRVAALKTLLVHPGIDELLALHRAEGRGDLADEAARKRASWDAEGTLCPPPLLTGHDLMEMGLTPGPAFRRLLERVREAQLEGAVTTAEAARALVREASGRA